MIHATQAAPRRLGSLGQSAAEFQSESAWWNLAAKFREASRQVGDLETQFRRDPTGSGIDGRKLIAARTELTNLQSQFQFLWTSVFGSAANLGLGVWQAPAALAAAGAALVIAAKLVALLIALAAIYQAAAAWRAQQQAASTTATSQLTLIQQAQQKQQDAAAAQARGDVAEARRLADEAAQLYAQAGMPGGQQDFLEWFQTNWPWVAAAVFAIAVGPTLLERI